MKRFQRWPLLLSIALAWMIMELAWVDSLGMGSYGTYPGSIYPPCCPNCPLKTEYQQHLWNAEAFKFLYCDDCCPGFGPYGYADAYAESSSASIPNGTFVPYGITDANPSTANGTADYWLNQGNNLYLVSSYEKAVASYAQALKLNPSLSAAWLNMGNALYFSGKYQESLDAYDAVIRMEPGNVNALRGKSQALTALSRTEEANATMEMARRIQGPAPMKLGSSTIKPVTIGPYSSYSIP